MRRSGSLWTWPFATPKRRIVTATVLAAAIVGVSLWGELPVWRTVLYVGLFAFYAVLDLALRVWARSRPDSGASLPMSIGGKAADDSGPRVSERRSPEKSSLGRPVKRYFRAGLGSLMIVAYAMMVLPVLPVLWVDQSTAGLIGVIALLGFLLGVGYLTVMLFVLTVCERGLVVRTGLFRRRSLPWAEVAEVTLEDRPSDIGRRGQALAVHLVHGEVFLAGVFWQSERSATMPSSALRRMADELDALRRGH